MKNIRKKAINNEYKSGSNPLFCLDSIICKIYNKIKRI